MRHTRLCTSLPIVWLLVIALALPCRAAAACTDTANEILAAQLQEANADSVQQWVEDTLAAQAAGGSADWYIIALTQSQKTYDTSAYAAALRDYIAQGTDGAMKRQRTALALLAAAPDSHGSLETLLNETLGVQGIMSLVFGLHLQNNGVQSETPIDQTVCNLVDLQLTDGGWALSGTKSDADVTAMVIQALAPHRSTPAVEDAISRALARLSAMQLENGGYQSYGTPNPESAAQVWMALSALDIDALTDARFIKNGSTLYDAILSFQCGSGQFSHTSGGVPNTMANVQVFMALTAYEIMQTEHRSIYLFSGALPPAAAETTVSSTIDLFVSSHTTTTTADTTQTSTLTDDTSSVWTPINSSLPEQTDTIPLTTVTTPHTSTTSAAASQEPSSFPLRWLLTALILAGAAAVSIYCFKSGRRHPNHYILMIGVAAVLIIAVHCIRIQSPEDYHSHDSALAESIGTVTFSIRCDLLPEDHTHAHLPDDGWITAPAEYAFSEGDTVLTLLQEVCRTQNIQLEIDGNTDALAYIRGIENLYELDYGALSGWVYLVNGASPSVGCGQYPLSDGDTIEWVYTMELGNDIP